MGLTSRQQEQLAEKLAEADVAEQNRLIAGAEQLCRSALDTLDERQATTRMYLISAIVNLKELEHRRGTSE